MRLQLALNVPDIDAAVDYYGKLFGTEPHKRRDGYANFAIAEPPLKLVLFENPDAIEHLHHIGVEVPETTDVETVQNRLQQVDLVDETRSETKCCHAKQDKLWTRAHNGLRWEWYYVSDEVTSAGEDSYGKTCCTGPTKSDNIGVI
ncbi:MAG: ArsI/CadI family heavy metal resistance metalloenzyme [Hyphomicrobiaceae bacterium]